MPTTAIPEVINALLDLAREVFDVEHDPDEPLVLDGFEVTEDPGSFLMIGVDELDDTGDAAAFSAESRQEWANATYTARDEWGDISCIALGWNGDGDGKAARDEVFAITNRLEEALRANPSLGLPTLLWTGFGTNSIQLTQNQHDKGAEALVVFRIQFRARL